MTKKYNPFVPKADVGKFRRRLGMTDNNGSTLPYARKIKDLGAGKHLMTPAGDIEINPHDVEMAVDALNMQMGENERR